jgi:hypothetical protein
LPLSPPKPTLYYKPGGILSFSGPELQEFLKAFLSKGAQFRFRARGFSMHPFIQDGDVITIWSFAGRAPKAGEVVAFCHPGTQKLMVHRVLVAFAGGGITRGDNSPEEDGYISSENLLGTVGQVERADQQVLLGLGPERRLIAWLSRHNLLQPFIRRTWQLWPALHKTIK